MAGIDTHWRIVDRALSTLDLGWDAWPQVVVDERITPPVRVSAVLVLLATDEADVSNPEDLVISMSVDDEDTLDWLGRARHPWQQLARGVSELGRRDREHRGALRGHSSDLR